MVSRRTVLTTMMLAVAALASIGQAPAFAQDKTPLTVFAAASLTDSLQAVGKAYTAKTGVPVRFSFASSSVIARQLEGGARADLFFSADLDWMDYVHARGVIDKASRKNLLRGRLALITPKDSTLSLRIAPDFPLLAALGKRGRIATGDPDYVPAGRYARASLLSLRVWSDVQDRLVRADNVRVALAYVARKEAPLGIVYETDAAVEPGVKVIGIFPENTHPPIVYPVALTAKAKPGARAFYSFVNGPEGQAIFRRFGFQIIG